MTSPLLRGVFLVAACAALFSAASPAAAQWAWRDASGKMVFSDQAPPTSIPAKNIVRRPDAVGPRYGATATPTSEAESDAKAGTATARPADKPKTQSLAEREIESRKRQQERAETEQKAAAEKERKEQTAQNCERMRSYLRALDDGMRVARVNASGEREVLDDAARAAETQRTRAQINQHCN